MSMTDPIADFLTRIRNAIHASHETVLMPASRQKAELARILAEQGYIDAFNVAPATDAPGDVLEIRLRYDELAALGDLGPAARLAARAAQLRRRQAHPARPGRHGHRDRLDLAAA